MRNLLSAGSTSVLVDQSWPVARLNAALAAASDDFGIVGNFNLFLGGKLLNPASLVSEMTGSADGITLHATAGLLHGGAQKTKAAELVEAHTPKVRAFIATNGERGMDIATAAAQAYEKDGVDLGMDNNKDLPKMTPVKTKSKPNGGGQYHGPIGGHPTDEKAGAAVQQLMTARPPGAGVVGQPALAVPPAMADEASELGVCPFAFFARALMYVSAWALASQDQDYKKKHNDALKKYRASAEERASDLEHETGEKEEHDDKNKAAAAALVSLRAINIVAQWQFLTQLPTCSSTAQHACAQGPRERPQHARGPPQEGLPRRGARDAPREHAQGEREG